MRLLTTLMGIMMVLVAISLYTPNATANQGTEDDLTMLFYADAIRSDDHLGMSVSESFYFNNTGTERFSGNVTLWFQQGTYIASDYCGSVQNMVARVESGTIVKCLSLKSIDAETYEFTPFSGEEYMSYFREKYTIGLNSTVLGNNAYNDQLDFNVTLGFGSKTSPKQMMLGNVSVSSSVVELGARAIMTWGPLRNITVEQTVNLTNNGGLEEAVALNLTGVPSGWKVVLRDNGVPTSMVTVPAGQNKSLRLNVTAPSYLLHVNVKYTVSGTPQSNGQTTLNLRRKFLQNVTFSSVRLWALENDVVTSSNGFEILGTPIWNNNAQRYVYQIHTFELVAGTTAQLNINWVPPPLEIPSWVYTVLAVLAVVLIAYPLLSRRKKEARVDEEPEEDEKPEEKRPVNLAELRERRDTLRKALDKLDMDEKEGVVPADIVMDMRGEMQKELSEIEGQLGVLGTVQARKKMILKALRRLEKDHKEGKVDKNVYESLKRRYENEAIKIMKQMEGLKASETAEDDIAEEE